MARGEGFLCRNALSSILGLMFIARIWSLHGGSCVGLGYVHLVTSLVRLVLESLRSSYGTRS
jgi:hypothetical protein